MYLDPPYKQKQQAMYHGGIDFDVFFLWLGGQRARYVLSLNGFVGDKDCRLDVPMWHYDGHLQVGAGQRKGLDVLRVTDSLYVRRED